MKKIHKDLFQSWYHTGNGIECFPAISGGLRIIKNKNDQTRNYYRTEIHLADSI